MTQIKDGKGTGNRAEVDDHGRLYTKANVISHMSHHATYHKNGFTCAFDTTLQGTSSTPISFLKNTKSGSDYEIYWMHISSDSNVEIVVSKNDTRDSGGTLCSPANTNFGSSISSGATVYKGGTAGDLVLSASSAEDLDGFYIGANQLYFHNYEGGLVLPFTKSLALRATGTTGDKVRVTLGFAIHTAGAKL